MFVNDPKGRELAREMGNSRMSAKFDVIAGGQHQVCVQNQDNGENIKFELEIKTGEYSEDRSQAITKKHLQPVELQAFKVNEMIL